MENEQNVYESMRQLVDEYDFGYDGTVNLLLALREEALKVKEENRPWLEKLWELTWRLDEIYAVQASKKREEFSSRQMRELKKIVVELSHLIDQKLEAS